MSAEPPRDDRSYVPAEFISVERVILHYYGTQDPRSSPRQPLRGGWGEERECACLSLISAKSRAPPSKLRWGPKCLDALGLRQKLYTKWRCPISAGKRFSAGRFIGLWIGYESMPHDNALGMLETTGLTPALAALDVMAKTASIRVLQAEINDFLGVCVKIQGTVADVAAAIQAGHGVASQMGGRPIVDVINRPDAGAWKAIESRSEFNPLIQQDVVILPVYETIAGAPKDEERGVAKSTSYALGLIETQGFTAVFEAIDSACKAANVEVIGKEKLGGGYVTVIIKGDVAAVKAAVEAGSTKVEGLGNLIAAHVIPRPSAAVLSLLPKG